LKLKYDDDVPLTKIAKNSNLCLYSEAVVRALLAAGADASQKTSSGRTPLSHAGERMHDILGTPSGCRNPPHHEREAVVRVLEAAMGR